MIKATFYLKNSVQFTLVLESMTIEKNTYFALSTLKWMNALDSEQLFHIDVDDISAITYHELVTNIATE